MIPSDTLIAVRSGSFLEHTLWGDPRGPTYVPSAPGEEPRYFEQGWVRLSTVQTLRRLFHEAKANGVHPVPFLSILLADVTRQYEGVR